MGNNEGDQLIGIRKVICKQIRAGEKEFGLIFKSADLRCKGNSINLISVYNDVGMSNVNKELRKIITKKLSWDDIKGEEYE